MARPSGAVVPWTTLILFSGCLTNCELCTRVFH
ncbi:Protein of unknown function [Bacillus cytotoxicus]|uniref:Uncharacterized protein n=1 Tax=Bacillus cytotoxicus TaxID=580165 RepID=A0AAX2CMV2_9BACI|nr:Protein of unknown function [Bacillus cytotoxicus]SCN42657.1 Protein of unknown function [Bacillus cytotoxicus]